MNATDIKIAAVLRAVADQEPIEDIDTALDRLTDAELDNLHRAGRELTSLVSYAIARRQPRVGQRRSESIRLLSQDQPS